MGTENVIERITKTLKAVNLEDFFTLVSDIADKNSVVLVMCFGVNLRASSTQNW